METDLLKEGYLVLSKPLGSAETLLFEPEAVFDLGDGQREAQQPQHKYFASLSLERLRFFECDNHFRLVDEFDASQIKVELEDAPPYFPTHLARASRKPVPTRKASLATVTLDYSNANNDSINSNNNQNSSAPQINTEKPQSSTVRFTLFDLSSLSSITIRGVNNPDSLSWFCSISHATDPSKPLFIPPAQAPEAPSLKPETTVLKSEAPVPRSESPAPISTPTSLSTSTTSTTSLLLSSISRTQSVSSGVSPGSLAATPSGTELAASKGIPLKKPSNSLKRSNSLDLRGLLDQFALTALSPNERTIDFSQSPAYNGAAFVVSRSPIQSSMLSKPPMHVSASSPQIAGLALHGLPDHHNRLRTHESFPDVRVVDFIVPPPPVIEESKEEEQVSQEQLNKELNEAGQMIWKMQLEEAEEMLQKRKASNVQFALYSALVCFLKAIVTGTELCEDEAIERLSQLVSLAAPFSHYSPDISLGNLFKSFSKKTLKPTAQEMALDPACVTIAEANFMQSLLYFRRGDYLKGALNIRKAWKIYEECIQIIKESENSAALDSSYVSRVRFGYGVCHFGVSLIPDSLKWVVEVVGMKPDRKDGLSEIRQAANSKTFFGLLAAFQLLWSSIFFSDNHPEAEKYLQLILKSTQNQGVPALFLKAFLERKQGRLKESISTFQKTIDQSRQLRQLQLNCIYQMGDCFYHLQDYEKAITHFEHFLRENENPSFRCQCAFFLGISYTMVGQLQKAAEIFTQTPNLAVKSVSFDSFASRKATAFGKNKPRLLEEFDKLYITASAYRKSKQFSAASGILLKIAKIVETEDQRASYYYLFGRVERGLKHYDVAKEYFKACIDMKSRVQKDMWLVPHSMVERAEILINEGEKGAEPRELLKKAKKFSNCDFEKKLIRRIKALLDLLDEEET